MMIFLAISIILIDLFLIFKNKGNPPLLIISFILFFVNYSIVVGIGILNYDYPMGDSSLVNSKVGNLFEKGIYILFVFQCIRLFFRSNGIYEEMQFKNNIFIYSIIICSLFYIGIFEIDRSFSFGYEVKISTLYEYSYLLFVFLIYYQGSSSIRNVLTHLLAFLFIIQDAYYGGRVTSIQIILTFALLKYSRFIKLKYILVFFPILLMLMTIVGTYRSNYAAAFSFEEIYNNLAESWFVQDTSLYAYFASAGHLYADLYINFETKLNSFFAFLSSIIFGSQAANIFDFDPKLPLVTSLSKDYHVNVGGGLIFTWFYFWFGWTGLVLLTSCIFGIIKKLNISTKNLSKLVLILIAVSSPRWYLYNPLAFFRGPLVLFPILYYLFYKLDKLTSERSNHKMLLEDSSSSHSSYKI